MVAQDASTPEEAGNTNTASIVENEDTTAETESTEPPAAQVIPLQAKAGKDRNVIVGRTVLFDASASTGPKGEQLQYHWDFGDGETAEGIDPTHIYKTSGTYKVILAVRVVGGDEKKVSEDSVLVSVQDRLVLLITD